ncbi:MAG: hypothetical protein AAGJ46_12175 [Planctomycetota bacterium]
MATGHGTALSFGTSSYSPVLINIEPNELSVDDVERATLATPEGSIIPYDPAELIEGGEVTFEEEAEVDSLPPIRIKQTLTITFRAPSGLTNGATWVFEGYLKTHRINSQQTGTRRTATGSIKVAGDITVTAAS